MNKFINDPDSLASLAGCAFWLFALAGLMSLFFNVITRVSAMTTVGRAWAGTALGILCAYLAFPAMFTFTLRPGRPTDLHVHFLFYLAMLPFLALFAGPGAFLLSWIHAAQMERWARRARTRREIRKVGVLLGLPLGIANLILVFGFLYHSKGESAGALSFRQEMLPWLIPAVAGGAGLGWGVTLGLNPGRAAPRPPARRTRLPVLRRDGPPFFDNRAARRAS